MPESNIFKRIRYRIYISWMRFKFRKFLNKYKNIEELYLCDVQEYFRLKDLRSVVKLRMNLQRIKDAGK